MSNLIERLKLDAIDMSAAGFPEIVADINEAIAALSPVLPNEVAKCISYLKSGVYRESDNAYVADLIERLYRGSRLAKAMATAADNEKALNNKLQQRIEELSR